MGKKYNLELSEEAVKSFIGNEIIFTAQDDELDDEEWEPIVKELMPFIKKLTKKYPELKEYRDKEKKELEDEGCI